ncbi:hypothetical protein DRH13_01335 [Candidatus Woesebacteria bacterium]|nr:MAG: hypothetical protein DRH13_01335 [Candidatus Woesebacteria bacterium]
MDENNPVNQGSLDKQKLEQLGKEMGDIKNETDQEIPPQLSQPIQQPSTSQPVSPTVPEDTSSQGLKKSKGILWIGIILLILSLVGVGAYYLGFRNSTSTPSTISP